jgi:biopolymer transport protein ExbB
VKGAFIWVILVVALAIAAAIYKFLLPEFIQRGGPLVVLLIMLSILLVTFIIERMFTLKKASGARPLPNFLVEVRKALETGDVAKAVQLCTRQRGSTANVLRAGLEAYSAADRAKVPPEKKMLETQRAMEEANALEVPLLERNLIALSTIASISTMVGLLGTVIGMIRSFHAMGAGATPDAIQLALGISEALINTAGGLFVAITGIVMYNVFVTRVDNFNYLMDESTHEVMQLLTEQSLSGSRS